MAEHGREPVGKPARAHSVADIWLGPRGAIAGTVYGTVVVMATLTVAYATEKRPWKLALLVSTTAFVLWIAHLYAHALSESITQNRRLRFADLRSIARREIGILLAAAFPSVALVAGAAGLIRETSAVWLALAIGLATLAAEGIRYARVESLSRTGTLVVIAGNLALGSFVVLLKVLVAH
jgi:hypothetical protein